MEDAVAEMMATATQHVAARQMSEGEFEVLYRKTARPLWSYIYRLCRDRPAADDIFQKTFLQFLRTAQKQRSEEELRGFLFRIATNAAMDYFREHKRNSGTPSREAAPMAREDHRRFSMDMDRVWNELSLKERTLLWLAHVEGTEHREIAATLSVKEKSVKVLLFRARKRLGELLTRKGLGPEVTR